MKNYLLILSYDGGRYRGWQRQGNTPNTIQARLEETLSRILGESVEAAGSGRTDAGVHALMQAVSFRTASALPPEEILAQLRRYLPEDIGAVSIQEREPRFHARLSCRGKTYRYRIWNSSLPCVFERRYVWVDREPLDVELMRQGAELLLGEHDFAAFCGIRMKKSSVRRVDSISITVSGPELVLEFTGNGFLYNMVRLMTGALTELGAGRLGLSGLEAILASRSRSPAVPTAPARGLCLVRVYY